MMTTLMKRLEAIEINAIQFKALKSLVAKGESDSLEFKRKASFPDKIICEMIAFANTRGGKLLIGVSDDGTIPGIKFPDEEIFVIQNSLLKYCRPSIKFSCTILAIPSNKFVIQYDIPQSRRKPHAFVNKDGSKEVFVRHQDKTIQASREMKQIIKRYSPKKNIKFRYGQNEDLLMKYLEKQPIISLDNYRALTGLNRYKASQSLVKLVLANVLQITPNDKGDFFSLHNSFATQANL